MTGTPPDSDDIYTRCPDCGFISPPSSMSYLPSAGGGTGIDWSHPVEATCMICHASHSPGPADVPALDDVMTCSRCQVLPVTEDADEGGVEDADVGMRKSPAAGVAAGLWW